MTGHHHASSVLTLLVLLTGASLFHLSTPGPVNTPVGVSGPHTLSGDEERWDEERQSLQKEETEEELFKDVDPKTLAAVLLEALNRSQVERRKEGGEHEGMEEETKAEREVRTMDGADRDRDGRQKLELLMATQGKEQEREEEEERKRAQEEEEKMTEKVTSRTTSQTVQVQTEQRPSGPDGRGESGKVSPQQQPTSTEQGSNEEEEQLSPEELKSLETMMKEFPRLDTATKRKGESEQNQRESRGYSSHNDIIPINKGSNLAMSKKKLKWQEETQKGLNFPTFRGGNFMDDFDDSNYGNAVQSPPPAEQEVMEEDEPEDEEEKEEDEELLSPEEEEARAKAEQEEMRRQAAEAQRAKMEEEKLADIASDMLLRYMVKQNGNRKYSSSLSNAAEDKRSDEDQEVMEEDDIDPQTIDKLIEISSKLHLPADDVVDIISDVEKKKKKDVPPELMSRWQQPLTPLSSSFSSTNGFTAPQVSTNQNNFPVSKQPSPPVGLHKPWFLEKTPKSQDLWSRPSPLLANANLWAKPQKPLSIKQDLWLKSPKSVWTGYPSYPYVYPFYYQRKPYPDYYPIYFSPPPRPRPRYYIPKPALTLNNFLGNSVDDAHTFPPKHRYHSWVQPRLRKPPLQQKPYYTSYPLPLYPRTFQPLPVPKARPPPRMPVISPEQQQMYYSGPRDEEYYAAGKQSDSSRRDELQKYIQQILMKRPQMKD
ncbi:neurosecretory protein VGF [Seriola aureovittata]|uniref:neurosecretory protein VGF n=1 Tax=Seriola aureovittata TaxID=2871759 RepID=UPI0024BEB7CE|nr:neurosecretory protein VGF [Seriola aureovittata]